MSKVVPITRDGAIKLIRDLKGEIEEKLAVLAHMMLHERWHHQALLDRCAQLEDELACVRHSAHDQVVAKSLVSLSYMRDASRYQRMAKTVVRHLESGHIALAKSQAQQIVNEIQEKEYGTNEGTGHSA